MSTRIGAMLFAYLAVSGFARAEEAKKSVPFYFPPGVIRASDPVKQMQEYLRYLNATDACFSPGERGVSLMPGSDSIRVETDITSTSSVTKNPAKLTIVLDNQVRMDGKVRVTTFCGQRFITESELQTEVADLVAQVNIAADMNYAYYKNLTDKAVKIRAEKLGIPEADLRKQLDQKVPGYEITFRELHRLPKPMRRSDFVPRELHLGSNPEIDGVLGVCWLNTGIIYYNPMGRIADYLKGLPMVLQHEMIHNNVNLQKFPIGAGFDVELVASIPDMLYPENSIDLFYHGYTKDLRELAWIYFGFNFKQAREEILKYDLGGNILLDEKKYHEHFALLEKVKEEMMTLFEDKVLPEFYSDPVWWSSMNDRLNDRNTVFRVVMATNYDPTILGGRKETMTWLEAHREEILAMAKKAWDEMGEKKSKKPMSGKLPQFLVDRYLAAFTAEELETLAAYAQEHNLKPADILKMKPQDLLRILRTLRTKPMGGAK